MDEEKKKTRIVFISFLQFIGVVSVIFGHSMNGIQVPSILVDIKAWVYTWHMPLFFFVSAFLFSYKGGYDGGYRNVLSKRFWRLVVPYLFWNLLFIIPKYLFLPALEGLSNDTPVEFSPSYFIRIILKPRDNILGHTWFLFALFEMFIVAIVFDKVKKKTELWIPIILALTIVNCFGVENRWLAVGDLMKNSIFFWCGMLVGSYNIEKIENFLRNKTFDIAIILLTLSTTVIWAFKQEMLINTLILAISVLFLPMILQVHLKANWSIIEYVSRNSFPIYIMHWPVIMVIRLVFYQKLHLAPIVAQIINLVFGFAIPCGAIFILRKIKKPLIKKVCTIIFGM